MTSSVERHVDDNFSRRHLVTILDAHVHRCTACAEHAVSYPRIGHLCALVEGAPEGPITVRYGPEGWAVVQD